MSELIPIKVIIWLCFCHWVADFIMQSDWMAKEKAKSNKALLIHCFSYGATIGAMTLSPLFGLVQFLIHIPVDYVTSRINAKLYADKKIHWFFVSIGFDQFIHLSTLILLWRT